MTVTGYNGIDFIICHLVMAEKLKYKESSEPFTERLRNSLRSLSEGISVSQALKSRNLKVSPERRHKVRNMLERWGRLIWTEYHLWWTLGTTDITRGIDCSHFVAYSMWLSDWKRENTWTLDAKYKKNEVKMSEAKPGDLLMWPWHYDRDVGRQIGHVEIVIWKTFDGKLVTLWASWLSSEWNKYSADGKKLPKHNCVWYAVRTPKAWMRILRA